MSQNSGTIMATIRKNQEELPPISKTRIDELKAIPDEKIDYGDISELDDDEFWENAEWVEADKTLPLTIIVWPGDEGSD